MTLENKITNNTDSPLQRPINLNRFFKGEKEEKPRLPKETKFDSYEGALVFAGDIRDLGGRKSKEDPPSMTFRTTIVVKEEDLKAGGIKLPITWGSVEETKRYWHKTPDGYQLIDKNTKLADGTKLHILGRLDFPETIPDSYSITVRDGAGKEMTIIYRSKKEEEKIAGTVKEEAKKVKEAESVLSKAEKEIKSIADQEKKKANQLAKSSTNGEEINNVLKKFEQDLKEAEKLRKKGEVVAAAKIEKDAILALKEVTTKTDLTDEAYKEKIAEGLKGLNKEIETVDRKTRTQRMLAKGVGRTADYTKKEGGIGWYPYTIGTVAFGPFGLGGARLTDYLIRDKSVNALKKEEKWRNELADKHEEASEELGEFKKDANKLLKENDLRSSLGKVNKGLKHADDKAKELKVDADELDRKVKEQQEETRKRLDAVIEATIVAEKVLRTAKELVAKAGGKVASRLGVPEELGELICLQLSNAGEIIGDIASGNKTPEDAINAGAERLLDDVIEIAIGKIVGKVAGGIKTPKALQNTSGTLAKEAIKDLITKILKNGLDETLAEIKKENPDFAEALKKAVIEAINEKIPGGAKLLFPKT